MRHAKLFWLLALVGIMQNPPSATEQAKFVVEIGHSSPIWAVAISPDGRIVATAGSDGARLWDSTGKELRQFGKQTGDSKAESPVEMDSVAFSRNGQFVLTAGIGSPARLWDAATGDLVREFGTSGNVYSAGFSPDGKLVMTGAAGGTVQLWDASSGHEIQRFVAHPEGALQLGALSLALSADGRFLLSAFGIPHTWFQNRLNDSAVRLWDVVSGKEVHRFVGHPSGVLSVAFLPDGKFALTAGSDKTVRVWDLATGKELRRFGIDGPNEVESAAFSPDGRFVLTASRGSGRAVLWDTGTGQRMQQFEGHKGRIWSTGFSPDGRFVLTGSEDRTARLWSLSGGQELRLFEGQTTGVFSAKLSYDGRYLISTRLSGTAQLWDLNNGRQIRQFEGLPPIAQNTGSSVAFSPDGKFVLTGSGSHPITDPLKRFENIARLWDTASGQEVRRFVGHSDGVWSVAFSLDGKFALTGSGSLPHGYVTNSPDNTARLWDVATGKEIRQFSGHSSGVESVSFSPNGEFVLTGGADNTVRIWETATGKEIRKFEDAPFPCAFSPDGKWIVAGGNGTVRLWDAASRRDFLELAGNLSVRVNQDGTFTLGASSKQGDRVVEGKWLKFAVFSPDSRSLLTDSGFGSKSVLLWDVASGRFIRSFESDREVVDPHVLINRIASAAFSSDGKLVIAGGTDGTVRLWDVVSGHEVGNFERSPSPITSVGSSPDRRYLFATSEDGRVRIWNGAYVTETSSSPALTMVSFRDGGWALGDSDGRFDSDRLEQIQAFHWVFPDDPFRALPAEIFMRDYYEPRLLPRLLAGEQMPKVRPLQDLNRVQPEVKIVSVNPGKRSDFAEVEVEVSPAEGQFQRNGKAVTMKTDAYDLRLFRTGQLVGQEPEPKAEVEESLKNGVELTAEQLQAWREARRVKPFEGRVQVDAKTGKLRRTFTVRLPHGQAGKEIEFTAYAFNEDRVKSDTARASYIVLEDAGQVRKRAYVITMGVNAYQRQGWNLHFAASDAKRIQEALSQRLPGYEMVPVTMISDCRTAGCPENGDRRIGQNHATKAALHAVLEKLAGHELGAELKKSLPPGTEKVEKAEPDDLVMISISSHGYTDKEGTFYMVPSDSGDTEGNQITLALLEKWISSEEMSAWLRDVDAGDLVMIVDTCHSAATVEEPGFKPGPMGSRGLGQLAYDKGMRILAASQADDVALESEKLKQGLLTYALVENGLEEGQAVGPGGRGEITIDSWLQYGVDRVPGLYEEVRAGKVQKLGVGTKETNIDLELPGEKSSLNKPNAFQQPSFFNFRKRQSSIQLEP